ncbi:MAG: PhnD/SsuA/transferrin family substrate-binding protein [Arenicellales bacterium]
MITVANLLSQDLNELAREICASLEAATGEVCRLSDLASVDDFRDGRAGIALICGLAYSLLQDAAPERFVPVAAPLIEDGRTGHLPVYFSDIVVPAASDAGALEDLAGARFAYNETVSFSGYRALEYELAARCQSWEYFSKCIRTGTHRESLRRLAVGEADAAAIDSQVLILEKRRDAALAGNIRTVASLGPYPAPPVVINREACDAPVEQIRAVLRELPRTVLDACAIRGWESVDDAYYDAIREVACDTVM